MLIIGRLNVRGSYKDDLEYPAEEGRFDTVQFWIDGDQFWRIRTFQVDHDIHVFQLEGDGEAPEGWAEEWAKDHIRRHFADVLRDITVLRIDGRADPITLSTTLASEGLEGYIVQTPHGFTWWNPDVEDYRTQSEPRE